MNNMDELFPKFQKSIENLIEDEEGNIPGKKLLVLGTMIVVLGSLMQMEVFAGHDHIVHISLIAHIVQGQVGMEITEAMRVMQAIHRIQIMVRIQIRILVMQAIHHTQIHHHIQTRLIAQKEMLHIRHQQQKMYQQ